IHAVLSDKAPSYVKDKQKTAQALAGILHVSEMKLLNYMDSKNYEVQFGTSGARISFAQEEAIRKLKLPGIYFDKNSKREYPNGDFASYEIGFTVKDSKTDQETGAFGIEKSLNSYLSEQDGIVRFYSDKKGNLLPDGNQKIKKPHNGDNVTLTIDNNIQSVLDDAMTKVEKAYKPKRMIAIVADPKTGAILGMSNRPSFNPNTRDITNYLNNAISYPYEPGSVMKVFTLSAAINEGVWNSNETYPSGHYTVDGVPIHDWNQSWGTITYQQGLERSSNVAFSRVEDLKLGPDKFYNYLKAFGFTQKTGIDLPNEQNSQINFNTRVDQVMTSFGQASAVTAIQIVQAATAVANNGTMMKPYVVQKIENPDTNKVIKDTKPTVVGHPITAQTATEVRDLLRGVVSAKDGTGNKYDLPGYQVIGKTGTAQIGGKGGYLTGLDNYVFSFLGMAPKDDPKLIVYVAIDRPHLKQEDGNSASVPLSKIFNPTMSSGLQYLQVRPDGKINGQPTTKMSTAQIGQYTGQSITEAADTLKAKGLSVVTIGSGAVKRQSYSAGMKVFKGSQIILLGESSWTLPDLTHWSLNEVLSLCQLLDLKPNFSGSGFVAGQQPTPGTSIKSGDKLTVTLQSPDAQTAKPDQAQTDSSNSSGN
ncbi:MAG TPA: penicillin-binding transpeptidase domain-containing protein, partial [Candidatus Angelobacter sp.]|nr:penicillin-binding transpeptidase domain-containing protein [Candidatus Angelobacter sp.]